DVPITRSTSTIQGVPRGVHRVASHRHGSVLCRDPICSHLFAKSKAGDVKRIDCDSLAIPCCIRWALGAMTPCNGLAQVDCLLFMRSNMSSYRLVKLIFGLNCDANFRAEAVRR